jgi:hypothetical protein
MTSVLQPVWRVEPGGHRVSLKKTCFVVMGFGKKTDFESGRTLDLDKTYRNIIKPTVEECGLACVRADEIRHSGVIDVPMYSQLLEADLVIADLSTNNGNAMYELGVRHALKPYTTIVIAESKLKYPFDVSHTAVRAYQHLGEGIEFDEVMRFRALLKDAVTTILARPAIDSPVYTYLPTLTPPALAQAGGGPPARSGDLTGVLAVRPVDGPPLGTVLEEANAAIDNGDFATAKALLTAVWASRPGEGPWTANDDYLVQRIALATYKSRQPSVGAALAEAQAWLERLNPNTSNDTETLGLWGAVRKRRWDLTQDRTHLDAAVRAYGRGFYLRNDYYNGINLAFLLNVRASVSAPAEAIADFVEAGRIRAEVIQICQRLLSRADTSSGQPGRPMGDTEARYWVLATLAEATLGRGDVAESQQHVASANALTVPGWMKDSTAEQLGKLQQLLAFSPLQYIKTA